MQTCVMKLFLSQRSGPTFLRPYSMLPISISPSTEGGSRSGAPESSGSASTEAFMMSIIIVTFLPGGLFVCCCELFLRDTCYPSHLQQIPANLDCQDFLPHLLPL